MAAVANANTVFFISEASVVSGTSTGSPAIVSPIAVGGRVSLKFNTDERLGKEKPRCDLMSVPGVRRERRRVPVGANPTRQPLQPDATEAVMEVTKWLKPLVSVSQYTVTARVCRA